MNYFELKPSQIFKSEVEYTLDEFIMDFRERLKDEWKGDLDKENGNKTLFQGLFLIVVFASQGKSKKFISEIVFGGSDKKRMKLLDDMLEIYQKEIEIMESFQMKMFLQNLEKYHASDAVNLKLLNEQFREWFSNAILITD